MNQDKLNLIVRYFAPTPRFFQIIRNIGLIVGTIGAAVLGLESQGITLPEVFSFFANKLVLVASVVASIVSQFTVDYSHPNVKALKLVASPQSTGEFARKNVNWIQILIPLITSIISLFAKADNATPVDFPVDTNEEQTAPINASFESKKLTFVKY